MLHTIDECVKLTRKSRMTLYRKMNEGQLSYSTGHDDRRRVETTELIRVFGDLYDIDRSDDLQSEILELRKEINMVYQEINRLRIALEHKPEAENVSIGNALKKRIADYLLNY